MSNLKQRNLSVFLVKLVVTMVCFGAAWMLFVNRQYVVDQVSVWQYQPTSPIASLAERSGMSGQGKFYFYASRPTLETAETFNKECDRKEEKTAILGCYNGQNIYIYNVTDSKLDGIREVTAAHEMLHSAYDRLNNTEKQTLSKLLAQEYQKLKTDKTFADRIAFYDRTEPDQRDNELHSIIGTEVSSISSELEQYYARYFVDRSKVVTLHAKYARVFEQLQNKSDNLANELTQLSDEIKQETEAYNQAVADLNKAIETFNSQAQNGGFADEETFQRERSLLIERADRLDERRTAINDNIDHYEALRQELAALATQSAALNRSIDSSLAPAPSL